MSRVRQAKRALHRFYGRHMLRYELLWRTWWRHGRHHAAPVDPFTILWVNPSAIDAFVDMEREDYLRNRYDFGVVDGDWDLNPTPITQHFVYTSIRARFVAGLPWVQTPLYEFAMEGIRSGVPCYHRTRTTTDLERRLAQLERLHADVREDGFRTQAEIERRRGSAPLSRHRTRAVELDEMVVHIDREGRFLFVDGIHRLSIAKVLGVSAVPVHVLWRHANWQAHRDAVAKNPTAFPETIFEHPDLAGLQRRAGSRSMPAAQRSFRKARR